jgi:O-antigen ligase
MLIVSLLTDETKVQKYVTVSVALTGWLAASSLYEYHAGVREFHMGIERATGLTSSGGDANTLGITLVTTMPFEFLLMAKGNPKWMRILGLVIFVISVSTVITTGSRTSFFSFLLFLALVIFLNPKNLKFLPLVLVLAPVFWLVIPDQYKKRYETVDNLKEDDSFQNRRLSWEGGERMFMHNPLTGVGTNNYTFANGMKYWPGEPKHWLNAHSLYFMVLGELGSLGVLTFGTYVISLILLNRRLTRELRERGATVFLQKYPGACNLTLYLLLFTGYSAHNLYRSSWYMMGAISGAIGLLKKSEVSSDQQTGEKEPAKLKWVPWSPEPAPIPESTTPAQVS